MDTWLIATVGRDAPELKGCRVSKCWRRRYERIITAELSGSGAGRDAGFNWEQDVMLILPTGSD
jgi:hypothetical protein